MKIIKSIIFEVTNLLRNISGVIFILVFFAIIGGLEAIPLPRLIGINLAFLFFLFIAGFVVPRLYSERYDFTKFSFNTFFNALSAKPKKSEKKYKRIFKFIYSVIFTIVAVFSVATLVVSIVHIYFK